MTIYLHCIRKIITDESNKKKKRSGRKRKTFNTNENLLQTSTVEERTTCIKIKITHRKFKFEEEYTRRHKRKKRRLSKQFRQGQCRLACAPMAGVPQCPPASSQLIFNTDAVDLSSYHNYSNKTF